MTPDACPICDYNLVGLPDEHTCPECGLEYDENTLVIEKHSSKAVVTIVAALMALGAARAALELIGVATSNVAVRTIDVFKDLLGLVICSAAAAMMWRMRSRPAMKLVVAKRGPALLIPGRPPRTFDWNDIEGARRRQTLMSFRAELILSGEKRVHLFQSGNRQEIDEIISAVESNKPRRAR